MMSIRKLENRLSQWLLVAENHGMRIDGWNHLITNNHFIVFSENHLKNKIL